MSCCLWGERTVRRSCKRPPKEGNMMSELLPPTAATASLHGRLQASEHGRGWGEVCVSVWGCVRGGCRCWVKRVSNSNLHLRLERLPLRCQSAVQSSLPLSWQQSPASCYAGAQIVRQEWMKFFTVKVSLWKTLPRRGGLLHKKKKNNKKTKGDGGVTG